MCEAGDFPRPLILPEFVGKFFLNEKLIYVILCSTVIITRKVVSAYERKHQNNNNK